MQLVNNIPFINTQDANCEWDILEVNENQDFFIKSGLAFIHNRKIFFKNKVVLKNKITDEMVVAKNNIRNISDVVRNTSIDLIIPSALNEYVWTLYADKLKLPFQPITLSYVLFQTQKKVASLSPFLKEHKSKICYETYYPVIYRNMKDQDLFKISNEIKVFAALIGLKLWSSNILYDQFGDIKIVDTADAHPDNIKDLFNNNLKKHYQNIEDENDKLEYLNLIKNTLQTLISNVNDVTDTIYSVYNKVNLHYHTFKKKPEGFGIYLPIWYDLQFKLNNEEFIANLDVVEEETKDKLLTLQYLK